MNDTSPSGFLNLITGILTDVRLLLRQEVELLKDEVKLELSKAGRAASGFGIGAALIAVGAVFFLLMLVHGLHEWTVLPLWACYGVVGGLLAAIGTTLLFRARSLAGGVHPAPRRSIHAMKENVQWIKDRMTLKRI